MGLNHIRIACIFRHSVHFCLHVQQVLGPIYADGAIRTTGAKVMPFTSQHACELKCWGDVTLGRMHNHPATSVSLCISTCFDMSRYALHGCLASRGYMVRQSLLSSSRRPGIVRDMPRESGLHASKRSNMACISQQVRGPGSPAHDRGNTRSGLHTITMHLHGFASALSHVLQNYQYDDALCG